MSNRLEKFVRDNREHFDDAEPAPQIWNQLQRDLQPARKRKVIAMQLMRWSAAAAVVIICGTIVYYSMKGPGKTVQPPVATTNNNPAPKQPDILREINPTYAEEVYHFTKLIELKQSELKQIEKDDPALYGKFMSDINKLDSSYNALKNELPDNPNREQLLEAMIQNLRLQTELLNQQLLIIQKIKQAKNTSHENTKAI